MILLLLLAAPFRQEGVQQLIEKLSSDRIEVREEACRSLEEIGDRATAALRKAASDGDEETAARAKSILERIPLRAAATENLIRAVPGVIDRLVKGEPAEIFLEISSDLRARGEERRYPALRPADLERLAPLALRGAGPDGFRSDRRCRVCEEIARLGLRTAFGEAIDLLATGDDAVRSGAARLLQRLEAKEAAPRLCSLALHERPEVRQAVAGVLGAARASEGVPTLRRLLRDPDGSVRAAAASALRDLDAREAGGDLRPLLDDDSRLVRSIAAHAIGRLGAREAVPDLVRRLRDPSSDVRWWVVRALQELDARAAAGEITALLEDEAPEVRRAAGEAVASLKR
jgi:HEAT repeat protein